MNPKSLFISARMRSEILVEAGKLSPTSVSQENDTQTSRIIFVLVSAISGFPFSIDRKDNCRDILLAVMGGSLGHRGWMFPGRPEIFRHGGLQVIISIIAMAPAGLLCVSVNVDGAYLVEVDHVLVDSMRMVAGSASL